MIGSLRGRIASKAPPQLTIEVAGVGYEVEAPMSTFFHLPAVGSEACFSIHNTKPGFFVLLPESDPWTHQPAQPPVAVGPIEEEERG